MKEKSKCIYIILDVFFLFDSMMMDKFFELGWVKLVVEEEMEFGYVLGKVRLKCKDLELMRYNIMEDIIFI